MNRIFYAVVLGVSLTGATQSAAGWLHWWIVFAALAVGAVELGGVALSVHADRRRQLGERALPARLLSAAVAVGAVAVNYGGHVGGSDGDAYFFAGMSALGYMVWLIDSAARRRDALRAAGKLEGTAPAYGVWAWVRHPALTARARQLALRTPALGKFGSLAAASEQVRAERRTAAISAALRKRIAEHVDPTMATIAVNTYDLDEIAERLAAGADYAGLTGLLSAELMPAKLHRVSDEQPPMSKPLTVSTASAHDVAVSEAAMRGENVDGSPLITLDEQVEQIFREQPLMLADVMGAPPAIEGTPVSAPPAQQRERKIVRAWDTMELLMRINDGESDGAIGALEHMPSRATVNRVRGVYQALQANPLADVSGRGVSPDVVQVIRASVQR